MVSFHTYNCQHMKQCHDVIINSSVGPNVHNLKMLISEIDSRRSLHEMA